MEIESVVRWLRSSQRRIQRNGVRGALGATKPVYVKALQEMLPDGSGGDGSGVTIPTIDRIKHSMDNGR